MLVRLLVAILMVTGPIPVRVCTCAAASAPKTPVTCDSPESAPKPTKRCGCSRTSPSRELASNSVDAVHTHDEDTAPVDRHDRDCPAVNPAPVASFPAPSPTVDCPADPGLLLPAWDEPVSSGRVCAPPQSDHRLFGATVPLYLSLLSIRI